MSVKLVEGWQPGVALWEKGPDDEWIKRWQSFVGTHVITIGVRPHSSTQQYGWQYNVNNQLGSITPGAPGYNGMVVDNMMFIDWGGDGSVRGSTNPSVSLSGNYGTLPQNFEYAVKYEGVSSTFVYRVQWDPATGRVPSTSMAFNRVIRADGTVITDAAGILAERQALGLWYKNNLGKSVGVSLISNY